MSHTQHTHAHTRTQTTFFGNSGDETLILHAMITCRYRSAHAHFARKYHPTFTQNGEAGSKEFLSAHTLLSIACCSPGSLDVSIRFSLACMSIANDAMHLFQAPLRFDSSTTKQSYRRKVWFISAASLSVVLRVLCVALGQKRLVCVQTL